MEKEEKIESMFEELGEFQEVEIKLKEGKVDVNNSVGLSVSVSQVYTKFVSLEDGETYLIRNVNILTIRMGEVSDSAINFSIKI